MKIPHIWANIINGRKKEWFNQKVTFTKVSEYAQIDTKRTSGTILGVLRGHRGPLEKKPNNMGKYQKLETERTVLL